MPSKLHKPLKYYLLCRISKIINLVLWTTALNLLCRTSTSATKIPKDVCNIVSITNLWRSPQELQKLCAGWRLFFSPPNLPLLQVMQCSSSAKSIDHRWRWKFEEFLLTWRTHWSCRGSGCQEWQEWAAYSRPSTDQPSPATPHPQQTNWGPVSIQPKTKRICTTTTTNSERKHHSAHHRKHNET